MKFNPPSEDEILASKSAKLEAEAAAEEEEQERYTVRGTSNQSKLELRQQLACKILTRYHTVVWSV